MPNKFDDADDYEPSDSEDDYTERERSLLKKVRTRKQQYSDSEEEVLGVGASSDDEDDDDDNESDIALSDVEGQGEGDDDLPNERAWGKDRRKYYSTDYVDADYGGFNEKDSQLADLEEQEAKNLQKQLAEQLDDDDFSLEVYTTKKTEEQPEAEAEEVVKTDIGKLSRRQKVQLLEKESPEFFGLLDDFEKRMTVAKELLHPVMVKYKKGKIPNCPALDFVQTLYELIVNYSANIYMYLVLKASRTNVQNHPVAKRLLQYRQLISQLDDTFEEIIRPQIEVLLLEEGREQADETARKKTLKLLSKLPKKPEEKTKKKKKSVQFGDENPSKKLKLDDGNSDDDDDEEKTVEEEGEQPMETEEQEKRGITYQIQKNKGLTPHRKREQRNPRVKHRQKFRKAVVRRKGAVRAPRTELQRYGGEISGIKATVSKSIKIKS